MRDYDFMNACSSRKSDPFLATGERWIDNTVLDLAMASTKDDAFCNLTFTEVISVEPWRAEDDGSPIGGTRSANTRAASFAGFQRRLLIAAFGGIFLLAPMWLMVLHNTMYTSLVSTTVCVVVFGIIMSCWLEKEIDVMSSTAAYAAVLVVFVGLNTSGN